jgi:hypothetical protein
MKRKNTYLYSASMIILTPLSFARVHILIRSSCRSFNAMISSEVNGDKGEEGVLTTSRSEG